MSVSVETLGILTRLTIFDQEAGGPLGGFGTNTTLERIISTLSSSFETASSPC